MNGRRIYVLALRVTLVCLQCFRHVASTRGAPLCLCERPDTLTSAELDLSDVWDQFVRRHGV